LEDGTAAAVIDRPCCRNGAFDIQDVKTLPDGQGWTGLRGAARETLTAGKEQEVIS
jgi:hypothetical protein